MKVILKAYNSRERYEREEPSSQQIVDSTKKALSIARSHVAKKRGTKELMGFKVFTLKGEMKHKLPTW